MNPVTRIPPRFRRTRRDHRARDRQRLILPDPDRHLSGKHVRIDFRSGSYVLVDTSSNGTYVNGAQVPLGKYHDYVLKVDGITCASASTNCFVSIDKSNDFPPDESAIVAYDGQSPHAGQEIHRRSWRGP